MGKPNNPVSLYAKGSDGAYYPVALDEATGRLVVQLAATPTIDIGDVTLLDSDAAIGQIGGHGLWKAADAAITRPNTTPAYTAHQAIGDAGNTLFTWTDFFRKTGNTGVLTGSKLVISKSGISVPSGINIRGHLFADTPSSPPASDTSTFTTLVDNEAIKLGYIDFANFNIGGTGSDAINSYGIPCLSPLPLFGVARDLVMILETVSGGWTANAQSIYSAYLMAVED